MKFSNYANLLAVIVVALSFVLMFHGCSTAANVSAWPLPSTASLPANIVRDLQQHSVKGRGKIILNGNWAFSPTWSSARDFTFMLPVPGSWKWTKLLPGGADHRFDRLARGFYFKHVNIPPDWNH